MSSGFYLLISSPSYINMSSLQSMHSTSFNREDMESASTEGVNSTDTPHNRQRSITSILEKVIAKPAVARFWRIARLLALGYATDASIQKYENQENWVHFSVTLQRKLESIGIVSGLLLSANTNLLISGDLGRMTFTSTVASMHLSLISLICDILCLWLLIGIRSADLKDLIKNENSILFYYLYGTPSLFGGAAALSFFVAVGSWTWLELGIGNHGVASKILSVILGTALMANAGMCFYLGGSRRDLPEMPSNPVPLIFPPSQSDPDTIYILPPLPHLPVRLNMYSLGTEHHE
ncbi:hypothetical protein BDQ12DRAFT_283566 [Crucibulum laeve]|uniref:Uncharacterized protein n=1 Tax=Crucibulum laeve TaxID=68775 RepID=A0A5C3MCW9_9AGAR|nr:hypothetical protein BDQ12DRAFT_283566 [Crucibulum laeve]